MKLYMFRTVRLSFIRGLFTVHSAMVYAIQLSSSTRMELLVPSWYCSKAVYRLVWHVPLLSVQWINSWWWTKEMSETCTVSCQNKFVKLVHLFGFIIKKFVTMHGHVNVKFMKITFPLLSYKSVLEPFNSIFRNPSIATIQNNCQVSMRIGQNISLKQVCYIYIYIYIHIYIYTHILGSLFRL